MSHSSTLPQKKPHEVYLELESHYSVPFSDMQNDYTSVPSQFIHWSQTGWPETLRRAFRSPLCKALSITVWSPRNPSWGPSRATCLALCVYPVRSVSLPGLHLAPVRHSFWSQLARLRTDDQPSRVTRWPCYLEALPTAV